MNDLRTAAQQALEALEDACGDRCNAEYNPCWQREVAETLRAALAEPVQDGFDQLIAETEADSKGAQALEEGRRWVKEQFYADAEPVQEPVAWRWGYRSVTTGEMDWRGYVEIAAHPNLRSPAIIMEPLYTSPPQRKPLTEEEILSLFRTSGSPVEFARAIERAHGIK